VTIQTVFPQDRPDVFFEPKFRSLERLSVGNSNSDQHQQWCEAGWQLEEHTEKLAKSVAAAILRSTEYIVIFDGRRIRIDFWKSDDQPNIDP